MLSLIHIYLLRHFGVVYPSYTAHRGVLHVFFYAGGKVDIAAVGQKHAGVSDYESVVVFVYAGGDIQQDVYKRQGQYIFCAGPGDHNTAWAWV